MTQPLKKHKKVKPRRRVPRFALLIGCEYVKYARQGYLSRLPGCHADVRSLGKILRKRYGYRTKCLTDINPRKGKRQPTRKNIINWLKHVVRLAKLGTHKIIIYYSGHGTYVADKSNDEKDNRDEALVPVDFKNGFITDDWLFNNVVKQIPPKCRCLVISDSCHSGTILDLEYHKGMATKELEVQKTCKHKGTQGITISLSGCMDPQTSASAYNLNRRRKWRGAMTWALERVLRQCKRPTLTKTLNNLRRILARNRFSQIPELYTSRLVQPSTWRLF